MRFPAVLSALLLTLLSIDSPGQWGARCAAPVGVKVISDKPTTEPMLHHNDGRASGWWEFTQPGYWGWWRNGQLLGRWHAPSKTWQEWDGRRWLPPSDAPWFARPAELPGARLERGGINYGLETSKLTQHGERFLIGGDDVDRWEFEADLGDFRDDSKLPQVLVLDSNAQRREESYKALTQKLQGKARVNAADPTNKDQQPFLVGWKLDQDERFKQAGGFATFIQGLRDPRDGFAKVLGAIYSPMQPAQLAAAVEARIDPNYDPGKNPDGSGPAIKLNWSWLWNTIIYPLILLLLGGGAGAFAARRSAGPAPASGAEPRGPVTTSEMLVKALERWQEEQKAEAEAAMFREAEAQRVREVLAGLAK